MKATASKKTIVILEMTEREARQLMALVQNPLCEPDDEPIDEASFRYSLFNSLKTAIDAINCFQPADLSDLT